jgi:beta-glucosidase-like glycosyl hydrolase
MIFELVEMNIGGFCIFGGNPEQVNQMVHTLQARAKTPLLMSADFENGLQMRLSEGTDFPHAMGLGKLSHESVFKVAQAIAKEASGIGIKWNLAPVADVNTNTDNPVINIRSFGDNTDEVAQFVKSYIEGTQVEKVLACAKHFPGHGDTNLDSHLTLPVLNHKYDRLSYIEFEPFREAIKSNVASIMLGHLSVPAIDDSGIPASLSKKVVEILRDELNFRGLIVTDALEMKAISENYKPEVSSHLALNAGVNILLMPEEPINVINKLISIVESEIEFHEKIDISSRKIILYKRKFGLIPLYQLLESSQNLFMNHSKMALKYAYDAIEKIGDTTLLPIGEKSIFAGFGFIESDREFRSASRFFTMLAQATENDCDFGYINSEITESDLDELKSGTESADLYIFTIYLRGIDFSQREEKLSKINKIIDKLSGDKKRIIILFGNPYITDYLKSDLFVLTFSDSFSSLAASVVMLSGREDSLDY